VQPREAAQIEAEKTFEGFMLWSKRVALYSALFLLIVVVGCNSGVEDGQYPAYNGDQYSPSGIGTK
tara:strand:- start:27813 stop:28010 length:198 start_codon:yes stop_codon:yes gene_type:complete